MMNHINEHNIKNDVSVDDYDLDTNSYTDEGDYPMSIKVDRGFYTVYELKRKYDKQDKQIILDSAFQRENVWSHTQKAELIESILMGLPLPIFYFNEDKRGRLIVVDGRQRLTALFEYLQGDFALKNLKILRDINGNKFHKLDPLMQSKIEDYQIQAHVIQPPTPDRIKFDIFDRVNRAGTQLNKQEIRNALYQGNATVLLKEVVESQEFINATGKAFVKNSRMKDRYILLRFIAFELYFKNKLIDDSGNSYTYKNDIDELLGCTMEYLNILDENETLSIKKELKRALENSFFYLNDDGFRLVNNGKKSPVNMNVFEVIMHLMLNISYKNKNIHNGVVDRVKQMKDSDEFRDSIGNHRDNQIKIKARFKIVDDLKKEIEND